MINAALVIKKLTTKRGSWACSQFPDQRQGRRKLRAKDYPSEGQGDTEQGVCYADWVSGKTQWAWGSQERQGSGCEVDRTEASSPRWRRRGEGRSTEPIQRRRAHPSLFSLRWA